MRMIFGSSRREKFWSFASSEHICLTYHALLLGKARLLRDWVIHRVHQKESIIPKHPKIPLFLFAQLRDIAGPVEDLHCFYKETVLLSHGKNVEESFQSGRWRFSDEQKPNLLRLELSTFDFSVHVLWSPKQTKNLRFPFYADVIS